MSIRPVALRLDAIAALLFALLSVQYGWQATALAADAPLWMDEVLAVWTARQPTVPAMWMALVRGGEFNPPLYDLLLHLFAPKSTLALRLPSIVAGYGAALVTGVVAWRHAGRVPALVAGGTVLSSGLFAHAVQARPYAIVTAAVAVAVMLHDRGRGRCSTRRTVAIGGLLALAIGCNFYALLLAGALGVIELTRARVERRRVDRRMLAAIGVAGASILLWWPILAAARRYSAADTGAPGYYGRPSWAALAGSYGALLGSLALPLAGLIAAVLVTRRGPVPLSAPSGLPPRASSDTALWVVALILAAVPSGIWIFAVLVSHSHADRYTLAGALGLALAIVGLVRALGARADTAGVAVLTTLLVANGWRDPGEIGKADRRDAFVAVSSAAGTLPIVTGSGLRFLELRDGAAPAIGRRLVFADVPGDVSPDPTNRNQVRRWHAIRPDLPVIDARALCGRSFLLFAHPVGGGADPLPGWIAARVPLAPSASVFLTPVRNLPCSIR